MGCWGFGILESDDAMDWEGEIPELVGLNPYDEGYRDDTPEVRSALEQGWDIVLERLRQTPKPLEGTYYQGVGFQVFTVLLMKAGCTISETQRATLLEGICSCEEYQGTLALLQLAPEGRLTPEFLATVFEKPGFRGYSGMCDRLLGRKTAIEDLCAQLEQYPLAGGTSMTVPSRDLFEVMEDKMAGKG